MNSTQTTEKQAHEAALAADEEFQAQVIRQFGRRRAGDMRYRNAHHDAMTTQARLAFQLAVDKWRIARREAHEAAR